MMESLDAGCGARPLRQATVLCDLFPKKTHHRSGKPLKTLGKPFVCADISYLPFKSKIFVFVYCSNVLEHINNPNLALQELKRVGLHGLAKFPNKFSELFFYGCSSHEWLLKPQNNIIELTNIKQGLYQALRLIFPRLIKQNFRIRLRERLFYWKIIRKCFVNSIIQW